MRNLMINGERLWASLMELARIGATGRAASAGSPRAISTRGAAPVHPLVRGGRLHGRGGPDRQHLRPPPRPQPDLPPVMAGSHLDTQPTGGRFDGAYGVMAGLEVVRTLNDLGYETEAPVEIVAWTNEEGSRFSPAMVGSGVFAGVFALDQALATRDNNAPDLTLGGELGAHRLCRSRSRSAAVRSPPISRRISSRGRSSKPPGCRSASSPGRRASAGTRSP